MIKIKHKADFFFRIIAEPIILKGFDDYIIRI